MTKFLNALSIKRYRGIGPDAQVMTGFDKINLFVGANNSGKSIVLNFIAEYTGKNIKESHYNISSNSAEWYRGDDQGSPEAKIGVPLSHIIRELNDLKLLMHDVNGMNLRGFAQEILENSAIDGHLWLAGPSLSEPSDLAGDIESIMAGSRNYTTVWYNLWHALTKSSGGSLEHNWQPETRDMLRRLVKNTPTVASIIPAKRQLGPKDETFDDLSGKGLIDRLAEIQSPDHFEREKREIFDLINSFVSSVINKPNARIEVPHDRRHLLVHIDNKVLPLSSLGTGMHEVILIAAFCTINKDQIICIEEPEIHLHPLLQRKLIEYLRTETSNQYFIATHSATLIDTEGAAVYHVSNDGKQTEIKSLKLQKDRRELCAELGYRASDIVQSNCIIWVEGPSDRIYLNKWISSKDESLIEGIHYSIMFYGGRLLSHLSADNTIADNSEIDHFIDLLALNKNVAILIDSDQSSANDEINATKIRLQREITDSGGLVWITKGREIENYVPHNELQGAVKQVYDSIYLKSLSGGPFDHALYFKQDVSKSKAKSPKPTFTNVNKVAVASIVTMNYVDMDVLDLSKKLDELIEFIKKSNT